MEMITIPVSIPKNMIPYIELKDNGFTFEQNAMLLYPLIQYPLIQNLIISHGKAAEILGVRKWDLIEFYNKMGIPYLNQTPEELDEEIPGFAKLKEKRTV